VAVRVKLRIRARSSGRDVETAALVNSGFETTTPQLLIPRRLAEELGIWPDMALEARIVAYGTAGGLVRNYLLPRALEVSLVEEDIRTETVVADAVISDIEEEVLISDKLTGRLGIILEDVAEGIYALKADPDRRPRRSYPPERW